MSPLRMLTALAGLATIVVVLTAAPAAAHATLYSPDGKVKFTYGHLNEPIYTYQKTGLDLGIADNATGGPITGLEAVGHDGKISPKLNLTYVHSGQELDISNGLRAQHGKPGWYTYPILFTEPGIYAVKVRGTINGTAVDMTLQPAHEVPEMDEIMWPTKVALPAEQDDEIEALRSEVESLRSEVRTVKAQGAGGNAPGPDAVVGLLAIAALVAVAGRRRA